MQLWRKGNCPDPGAGALPPLVPNHAQGPPLLGAGAGAGQGLYPGLGPDLDQGVVPDPGVDRGQGGILGTVRQPRLL